ncbi:MAG: hypothetical protein Q8K69_06870 [Bacteroidota bacterium]|nr:hypothetical protein [Bacteroidota bacterium]
MMITRDNYESFFLDYLEGNLKETMIDQFLDFLEQNPDLKEELQLFDNIHLPEEQVAFSGKQHLYKIEHDEKPAFEMKTIAYMEGDLKDDERKSFETFLSAHPELQKEYNLFGKTRLIADTEIKFPQKHKLYRKSGTIIALNWVARAAAVVVLIWGINSLFQTVSQKVGPSVIPEIASVKPQSKPAEIAPEKIIKKTEIAQNTSKITQKPAIVQEQINNKPEQQTEVDKIFQERDLTEMNEISPILSMLESETVETQLAVSREINMEKINDSRILTIDEFLASRAKKIGNEGLNSVQRIFRTGLNVASELSGDRIGYNIKDGKVSSLEFETRLMAFSIPLEKK